ncbi:MAG: lytic transglycosylase domain-containing protein [Kiloniellales bacterium]
MKRGICVAILAAWLAAVPAWAHQSAPAPSAKPGHGLLSQKDRQLYTEAFRKAKSGKFRRARKLAQRAKDPSLAKAVKWLELTEPGRDGNFEGAAAFLEANPDWPRLTALQRRAERAMPRKWPDAKVLAWFGTHPPISAEGGARHAAALMRAGEKERATALLRETWVSANFPRRDERAFHKRFKKVLRREDHIARLHRLLWGRKYGAAKRQARRLGGGYPALAEARRQLARRAPGVDWAVRQVPAELKQDPGLIYDRARWRQRKRRYEGVIELLDPPNPDAPYAARWWRLRKWTVRQALMEGDISVAYRIASAHGLERGLGFAEGEWLAGWIALRFLERPETAYGHFEHLHDGVTTSISLARSAFWAGEAAGALAEKEPEGDWGTKALAWYKAAAKHTTAFYGQLARRRLGQAIQVETAPADPPGKDAREAFERGELVRIARLLGEIEQDKIQERFLKRLILLADSAKDYILVAELARELGRNDLAVRTAKAARNEGVMLAEYLFPSVQLPKGGNPEPALVLAVVRQESGFYRGAVSHAGARGLMQLLPRTAKRVARRIKEKYSRKRLLTDPEYNLRLGRAYLADLTARYDDSYVLALAAYNAGPSRANRWIKAFGDPRKAEVDPVDWIESIPFDETRNYVQRILESLVIYRHHLGAEDRDPLMVRRLEATASWATRQTTPDDSCCL